DEAVVAVNGMFSERMYEIAMRASSRVTKVEAPNGKPVDPDDIGRTGKGKKIKMIGLAQGETSTGVLTTIDGFRKVADELGALLVVDTVASLEIGRASELQSPCNLVCRLLLEKKKTE